MNELCLRGALPRATASTHTRLDHPASGRARGWWLQLRDRLVPERVYSIEDLDDHLLDDIGLSRADVAALWL